MPQESHFNRAGRRSGGPRSARFDMRTITRNDLEILKQEAAIRAEFGEAGVRAFRDRLSQLPCCAATKGVWTCTLAPGHTGDHVAEDGNGVECEKWQ